MSLATVTRLLARYSTKLTRFGHVVDMTTGGMKQPTTSISISRVNSVWVLKITVTVSLPVRWKRAMQRTAWT